MGMIFESHRIFTNGYSKFQAYQLSSTSFLKPVYDLLVLDFVKDVVCGGLAGITAKSMFMPLDVIRKRLQVQGPVRKGIVIENVPRF
jgi:solute carrier family 25 (mitochondrial thiamine pyrophosphate transporter), member 19